MRPRQIAGAIALALAHFCFCSFTAGAQEVKFEQVGVLPRPKIEKYAQDRIVLLAKADAPLIQVSSPDAKPSGAIAEGFRLLAGRLSLASGGKVEVRPASGPHRIKLEKRAPSELADVLRSEGAAEQVEGKRLEQAYYLQIQRQAAPAPLVTIGAASDLGLYYGLVSLCQLVEREESGQLWLPAVRIADWPEIGLRLAKTSATFDRPYWLAKLTEWMPVYKMNLVGLQFHGEDSKEPGPFAKNVQVVCARQRRLGVLETVVYFCPFRGKRYDFRNAADQSAYRTLVHWILDQGAHGLEVDYNDWPAGDVPIEDVLNLAHDAVVEKNSQAYVLYCPPNKGPTQYRGAATAETTRILSKVPAKIWPLWTGMETLVSAPLTANQVETWTMTAGRRPFLYLNRVMLFYPRSFSQPLPGVPGSRVFRGDLLPKELNRLFEGIHFNTADPNYRMGFDDGSLAYFATAADYVWNPHAWQAAESYRRAKRFVEIMQPLVMPW
jgi:hypothetical protein